ncbi:MAG: methionine--tRNA ligase [Acidobacteriota bacterium]
MNPKKSNPPGGPGPARVLVTSALPYANGPIHFGHVAGAYLPADIYVRTRKARGHDVVYICGTDEHGVAITLTAAQAGVTPRAHVDHWHDEIRKLFDRLDIRFDHFSRTSTPKHARLSQEIFMRLVEGGWVQPQDSRQLYCTRDEMFLPDRYLTGTCHECGYESARGDECPRCGTWIDPLRLREPRCKVCGSRPETRSTRHWYLMLDRLAGRLTEFIEARPHWKKNVLRFVDGLLKQGLHPRPVTRDLDWGVPVPLAEAVGKVIYVWFDAPIGYITATQEWAEKQGEPEKWRAYWQDPGCQIVHFIGKDNIPFHCLTFPAMMMAQPDPWTLVSDVPANEFFNFEGGKFNTSTGWYIDLDDFFSKYSPDMIRWTICRNLPETADAEFTWKDFQAKVNGELADIYGNLAHRVLTFIHRSFDGVVPPRGPEGPEDDGLTRRQRQAPADVAAAVESFRLRDAAVTMMNLARDGNRYFDATRPWKTLGNDAVRCGTSLNREVSLLETLAVISAPFIPAAAQALWGMLGGSGDVTEQPWDSSGAPPDPAGRRLGEPRPLFAKIDDSIICAEIEALHARAARLKGEEPMSTEDSPVEKSSAQTPPGAEGGVSTAGAKVSASEAAADPDAPATESGLPSLRPEITIDDFLRCDFRLGKILDAEKVKGSRKLLKFTIDTGIDTRTILAGIQEHYDPADLVGKTVVVIANLKPRRMMGFDSQGMVLAAEVDGKLSVMTPLTGGLRPGARLS